MGNSQIQPRILSFTQAVVFVAFRSLSGLFVAIPLWGTLYGLLVQRPLEYEVSWKPGAARVTHVLWCATQETLQLGRKFITAD